MQSGRQDNVIANHANDYIVYNKATGVLSYDANGDGAGAAIQLATLTNHAKLWRATSR